MSIVILSNNPSEKPDQLTPQQDSIFKPYSFRNSITSTLDIPENAEVALQSCKITLDGSTSVEGGNRVFYLYLGERVDLSGTTGDPTIRNNQNETLSSPIRLELFPDAGDTIDVTAEEIAAEITRVISARTNITEQEALFDAGELRRYQGLFHPNYMNLLGTELSHVDVKRAADGSFQGYDFLIQFRDGQQDSLSSNAEAVIMKNNGVDCSQTQRQIRRQRVLGGLAAQPANYALTDDGASVRMTPQAYRQNTSGTTFDATPVSLADGGCTFDVTNCTKQSRGATDLFTRFCCGITRLSTTQSKTNLGRPHNSVFGPQDWNNVAGRQYWNDAARPGGACNFNWLTCNFIDYGVFVSSDGFLRVVQCVAGLTEAEVPSGAGGGAPGGYDGHKWVLVDYPPRHGAAPFNAYYNMGTNVGDLHAIKFECSGAKVKIVCTFGGGGGIAGGDYTLIEFNANFPRVFQNLKPINQTCWNMQPIMMINNDEQRNASGQAGGGAALAATDYFMNLTNVIVANAAGPVGQQPSFMPSYYTYLMENYRGKTITQWKSLTRRWLNIILTELPYFGYDRANHVFEVLRPALIVSESFAYPHTEDANTRDLFGFNTGTAAIDRIPPWVADTYDAPLTITTQKLGSITRPAAVSTKSIFVRLDNFNTKSMNAGNGNPSRIIAHLPRFDGQNETGRLFFEPNSLVYIDLHNATPLKVNQLDISFVYGNESLCEGLVGTSVVVLHFRKKS